MKIDGVIISFESEEEERGFKKGLMFFLAKERLRHLKDADKILSDMYELTSKGKISFPINVDPDIWVEP